MKSFKFFPWLFEADEAQPQTESFRDVVISALESTQLKFENKLNIVDSNLDNFDDEGDKYTINLNFDGTLSLELVITLVNGNKVFVEKYPEVEGYGKSDKINNSLDYTSETLNLTPNTSQELAKLIEISIKRNYNIVNRLGSKIDPFEEIKNNYQEAFEKHGFKITKQITMYGYSDITREFNFTADLDNIKDIEIGGFYYKNSYNFADITIRFLGETVSNIPRTFYTSRFEHNMFDSLDYMAATVKKRILAETA